MKQGKKNTTLRWQFIRQMLILMIAIALVSGAIQFYFLRQQINSNVSNEALMIGNSIEQGITETDLASRSIEQQIDYKLESISQRIGDKLVGQKLDEITNEELMQLKDSFHLGGITLIAHNGDDIVGVKATDPQEIGFSIRNFGPDGFNAINSLLQDKKPDGKGIVSYTGKNIINLFIAQSGSHNDKPMFYKYAYYHNTGSDYIINPYIEANEVYQFTQKVGPDSWISRVVKENKYAKEIAVLDPRVFADPELAKKMYPPLKKVVYGRYTFENQKDQDVLMELAKKPHTVSYVQNMKSGKVYKLFLPIDEGRVIYIALDYKKMSSPLYRHSFILILSGLLSLIALFMLTASFFSNIYRSIQQIISQIKSLEMGNLTAKSKVPGGGELADLSNSTNKMVDTLNQLLTDTYEKATNAQTLSVLLENEANQSVEKAYTMSMQSTARVRETIEDFHYFLDEVEGLIMAHQVDPNAKRILNKLDDMRAMAGERSNSTTEITITLSDLFKSLHGQSSELSDLSNTLLTQLSKFKL